MCEDVADTLNVPEVIADIDTVLEVTADAVVQALVVNVGNGADRVAVLLVVWVTETDTRADAVVLGDAVISAETLGVTDWDEVTDGDNDPEAEPVADTVPELEAVADADREEDPVDDCVPEVVSVTVSLVDPENNVVTVAVEELDAEDNKVTLAETVCVKTAERLSETVTVGVCVWELVARGDTVPTRCVLE